ncbi:MAG: nucleoside deaminase [Synechococcaceae cyanobacterium]
MVNSATSEPFPGGEAHWHAFWMERLLRLARRVGESGEIPVAAAVLDGRGRCVGWGSNRRHRRADPLGHAELEALAQAARTLGDWRLNACTLLVTLEPCPMCAGAAVQARVGTVVFAAPDPKRGALGGCLNLAGHPSAHHHMRVIAGVRGEAAQQLLGDWFQRRRDRGLRGAWRQAAGSDSHRGRANRT